jgi:hypothetical protein
MGVDCPIVHRRKERAAPALGEDDEFHPLDQIGQGVAHLRSNFGIDQRQMCLCVRRL